MTIIDASIIRFLALTRNSHDPGSVLRDSLMRAQLALPAPPATTRRQATRKKPRR